MTMKRLLLGCILIAPIALAGCGSGGGGTTAKKRVNPTLAAIAGAFDVDQMAATAAIADPDGDGTLGGATSLDHPSRPGKDTTITADDFSATRGDVAADSPSVLAFGASTTPAEYDRLGLADPGVDNEFEPGTSGLVGGFRFGVHTRTDEGTNTVDTVMVLDNRKDMTYRQYYNDDDTNYLNAATLTTHDAVSEIAANGVLTIATADVPGNGHLFSSTGFPAGPSQANVPITADTPFAGRFNGVPGMFECTGTCTATTGTDGRLSALGGDWTFTPTAVPGNSDPYTIRGSAQFDTDYLSFGYWLKTTTTAGGDTTYGVGTFAAGSMPFAGDQAQAAANALAGEADYSGTAVGMFATMTRAGTFTAQTTLTATFTAGDGGDTVSGMVENFMLTNRNGRSVKNDWTLTLNSAPVTVGGATGPVTFAGTTTGTGGTQGSWNGQFYGPQGGTPATGYPSGAAGEFTGHFEDGHVIGAFGAERQDEQ